MISKVKDIVKEHIEKNQLFSIEDKLILGISGGADSVCLMHLFLDLGVQFELAHCNFKLRGEESDSDEKFVKNLAKNYHLKIHCKSFDVEKHALNRNISIQMAAREIRYDWFNKLAVRNTAKYIAVGHHKDDAIETFFLNLIRGTGISGLKGILAKRDNIIRPLLALSRIDIENYLFEKKQYYKNDNTNVSLKYLRNRIRHKLLPLLEEINPKIRETIVEEMQVLKETGFIFQNSMNQIRDKLINEREGNLFVKIRELKKLNPIRIYLFELLKPFQFNQVDAIIRALDVRKSKQFFSKTHRLIIDREELVITKIDLTDDSKFIIPESQKNISKPINLVFSVSKLKEIDTTDNIAQFDYEKLEFPLILRKWKTGDKFKPLGMKRYKKLSDFFIDNKFSRIQKEQQWLLCSSSNIVWVVGCRIDDRYKVKSSTKKLYIAEILN